MIIFGSRHKRIKRFHDREKECPYCHEYTREFNVYQQYMHIFFIPFFPVGGKKITSQCCSCGHLSDNNTESHLKHVRTPLYLYTGLLLIGAIIVFLIFANQKTQKLKQEYISNPAVGDVYLIRDNGDQKGYYFMKVKQVKEDTVFYLYNRYIYTRYVSRLDAEDYFDLDNTDYILKEDLQELLDNRIINSVKRDYSLSTGFHTEKNSGELSDDI